MLNENLQRPRRLRTSQHLRNLVSEVPLTLSQLIQPYFVKEGKSVEEPIQGFSGVSRYSVDKLSKKMEADLDRGVRSFLLFGEVPDHERDAVGSKLYDEQGIIPETLRTLRTRFGKDCLLFTDVCLCPGTDHGHCGVIEADRVHNDRSLDVLCKMAVCHAEAGADFVAPSDMMDGRVGMIRKILDQQGHSDVGILAYSAKYASNYYGPFREALGSSPAQKTGELKDRATYQMDYRNKGEALRELALDIQEGADMVMVKPALAYLDIIALFREHTTLPVVAYSVSGEYEMVKRMAAAGLVDEKKMALENLTAIRRAGANIVITYYASVAAEQGWLK